MAWVLVGVRAGVGMRAEGWQGVLRLHMADRGYHPPPEDKSGVANSARLRGHDADSPELSAASAHSLRGVSGVPLRTWLPCRPRPGSIVWLYPLSRIRPGLLPLHIPSYLYVPLICFYYR